jgi:hypothetical protein
MKKKFRTLSIDGENWAWNFYAKGDYYDCKGMKIWKDKKVVFEKTFKSEYGNEEKKYKITPGLITRFIKIYLRNV